MFTCDTSGTLLLFYYIKFAANLIFIAAPIILIVMCGIDLFGAAAGNYSKGNNALNKAWSKILKRIIVAIVILILPVIINFAMSFIEIGSYSECFNNATKENIERLEKEEEAKKKLEEERRRQEQEAIRQAQSTIVFPSGASGIMGAIGNFIGGISQNIANVLNLPYYNQCDSRWGGITYDSGGATMCSSSCGYTSLAMIIAGLSNNSSVNPYSVVKALRGINDGGRTNRGYGAASTSELTNNQYLAKYNIRAQTISSSSIMSSLNQGHPVLVSVPGHYLTLTTSRAGNIVVLDPFQSWANPNKGPGEYSSLSQVQAAYGQISWAAAYQRG